MAAECALLATRLKSAVCGEDGTAEALQGQEESVNDNTGTLFNPTLVGAVFQFTLLAVSTNNPAC